MKNNAVVLSFLHRCFVLSTPLFCLSYTDVSVIILIRLICDPKLMTFSDVISDYFLGLIVVILFGGNEGTKKDIVCLIYKTEGLPRGRPCVQKGKSLSKKLSF